MLERFYEALGERLKKFNLELSAEKTRIIPFSPSGLRAKSSFNFLGFEFRWGKDRAGKPHVDKRTARKSLRNSLTRFKLWLKENRHRRLPDLLQSAECQADGDTSITLAYMATCEAWSSFTTRSFDSYGSISTGAASARAIIGKGSSNFWPSSTW